MGSISPRPHALIIEDELLVALALQAMLSELGFRSFSFASTEFQALEQAQLHCPDLLTVDVNLLAGDGAQAVDEIVQACGPRPVIYVTGMPGAVLDRPDAVIVEKPIRPAALAAAVNKARANAQSARLAERRPRQADMHLQP